MKCHKPEIGHPLTVKVTWYDSVPEPPREIIYDGEVIGWRDSQLIVRVKDYAVLRFWKHSGLEVGNPDHARRGLRVDLSELSQSAGLIKGLEVPLTIDTDALL